MVAFERKIVAIIVMRIWMVQFLYIPTVNIVVLGTRNDVLSPQAQEAHASFLGICSSVHNMRQEGSQRQDQKS